QSALSSDCCSHVLLDVYSFPTRRSSDLTFIDGVSSYLSVGLDVGADFTWMSIALPNGSFVGKPFKIIHSDYRSRDLAVTKIKERSEEHTSELQSRFDLVCRLLLVKINPS